MSIRPQRPARRLAPAILVALSLASAAADLPADAHPLIALCAPRPVFMSDGVVEQGDAEWVDARGGFMAAVAAGPAHRLFGKRDLGTHGNYLTDPVPPVGRFIEGRRPRARPQASRGAGAEASDRPSPRADRNSMLAHEQLLEKAKRGRIDVYFLGDSITRRWGTSDEQYRAFLENWRQNFFGWNAANFGWGGDATQHILWRLQHGELDGVNPKVIVLLAGTNNVGNQPPAGPDDPRVEEVTRGIRAILKLCRRKAPAATIVLMGITPRNDEMAVMPLIDRINANLARLADGKKIRYLNVNHRLADREGRLFEGMANRDGLHLDVRGYQVWADALKPIFNELLGPPAKEDRAPPPTGDPSVRRERGAAPSGG